MKLLVDSVENTPELNRTSHFVYRTDSNGFPLSGDILMEILSELCEQSAKIMGYTKVLLCITFNKGQHSHI